ncbi:unnamed protein product, partial [Ectocarpus sp. 12 AP-2014]
AVTCRLCQQQFFPASLKFHLKVCAKKLEHIELPCDHCNERFPCTVLQVHMNMCGRGRRRARTPSGRVVQSQDPTKRLSHGGLRGASGDIPTAGTRISRQQDQQQIHSPVGSAAIRKYSVFPDDEKACDELLRLNQSGDERSTGDTDFATIGGDGDSGGVSTAVARSCDGRIACSNCKRRFSSDRAGVHEEICKRVNTTESVRAGTTKSKRGSYKTKRRQQASPASPTSCLDRRRLSSPVVGGRQAPAVGRWARGRSLGRKQRRIRTHHTVDDAGDRPFLAQIDQAWTLGGSQGQSDTATITSSSPMVDASRARGPGALRSMGEEYRDSTGFSSLGGDISWLQPMDGRARSGALRDLRPWTERDPNLPSNAVANTATPRGEHEAQQRHARRRTSATVWESSSNTTVRAAGTPTRLFVGRAVSRSCSPVRQRRGRTSTGVCQDRHKGDSARGNVVGSGGGMSGDTGKTDLGRTKKGLGGGVEESFGGVGFFFPYARDGRRVSLLK